MGGKGQRFIEAGYTTPKPFIDIFGKPMFQVAIENLGARGNHIFLIRPEHHSLVVTFLSMFLKNWQVYDLWESVSGSVPACLLVEHLVNADEPLIIANSDQIIDWDSKDFYDFCINSGADGVIATFNANSTDHSYARVEDGKVVEVKEKIVISNNALCGIHYWKTARIAFDSFRTSLAGPPHFNGDYYIAPTYNELITQGKTILIYPTNGMIILGTPSKLEKYCNENSRSN